MKIPHCLDCGTKLAREPWAPELCPRCSLQLALEHSPVEVDAEEDPEALPTLQFPEGSLSPGQILGSRFQIRSLLGRGGMGEVWRAYDLKLRVDVALKTLREELLQKDRAHEALRQEVRTAREVISPNVCRVFDLVELDGQELVSMEYIDGTTLLMILQSRGPLELQEAREIASQFLAGLEAIHEAGLVHRDLKPENVMITRSGRVVVMDFGIAKGLAERRTGTVSGTPAYMAPEQARGEAVGARADVFSAGVILAEMIAPTRMKNYDAREAIWRGIHREPLELPDSPWALVLKKALSRTAEQRYPGAAALARALEEVTLRVEDSEDIQPYPGLASFTEDDAEYFFGRELEVEAMWKKLRRPHLLGLIGPSGAGKSSFLRAGLLPVMREGWRSVMATPGNRPFMSLARALMHELSGETDVMEQFLRFDEPDIAVGLFRSWRQSFEHALVVVDQFEELFTLNPPEIQERFAELLGRLAVEADVHVLLSMRDDFLYHCHSYEPLHPLLSELTLLGPPTGAALRRAVVQPALKCGYRFEDESLVEEILAEVENERGALPMLAFAASRLWEHRDRDQGLLTKEAYEHIGGVGGALAQHAEATLEKIGNDRIPVVQEIFRNMVTAQGTRAVRTVDELLSVFDDREAAKEVLHKLIDARLLTSFEVSTGEGEETSPRVEIIHESLLSAWPRLVRWQAQDAEGALLRDQLRQVAQLWQERGRPVDLLWTGTFFNEFKVWRDRYPGGLTTTEESFAQAMVRQTERRRRRRRFVMIAGLAALLAVTGIVTTFWRKAVQEALHREAGELLALGRLQLEDHPTAAVAYTLASLERADSPEARRFAMEALWRGPMAFVLPGADNNTLDFSPDGRWLAAGGVQKGVILWSHEGGPPHPLVHSEGFPPWVAFGPDSNSLFVASRLTGNVGKGIRSVSVPSGKPIHQLDFDATTRFYRRAQSLITSTEIEGNNRLIEIRHLPLGESKTIGLLNLDGVSALDLTEALIAYARDGKLFLRSLDESSFSKERLIGEHEHKVLEVAFDSRGQWLAAGDESGAIRFWPLEGETRAPIRNFQGFERAGSVGFDPTGKWMFSGYGGPLPTANTAWLWDLEGASDAGPTPLRIRGVLRQSQTCFHPNGKWLAVANANTTTLWPITGKYSRVLKGHTRAAWIAFTPDNRHLVSSSRDGTVRLWPLSASSGEQSRVLFEETEADFHPPPVVDENGRHVLVGSRYGGSVYLIPLHGGTARRFPCPHSVIQSVAMSDDGRFAAASGFIIKEGGQKSEIHIWDLDSGEVQVLIAQQATGSIRFMPDGRLLSSSRSGLHLWDLDTGTSEFLREKKVKYGTWATVSPDASFVILHESEDAETTALSVYDLHEKNSWNLSTHGNRNFDAGAFVPIDNDVVTGDPDGVVRVGPLTGEEPHLLFGHRNQIASVAISPDSRWIATSSMDGEIRLWPMPEGPPLHTLPYEELLDRLRSVTNLRVVPGEGASNGYRLDYAPFPGWEKVPEW